MVNEDCHCLSYPKILLPVTANISADKHESHISLDLHTDVTQILVGNLKTMLTHQGVINEISQSANPHRDHLIFFHNTLNCGSFCGLAQNGVMNNKLWPGVAFQRGDL